MSTVLKTTNMHLLIQPKSEPDFIFDDAFQKRHNFKLPKSCRITYLNLQMDSEKVAPNHGFNIFSDVERVENPTTTSNGEQMKNIESRMNSTCVYEYKLFCKGLKEKTFKGRSIWNT